jgi:hypothetical protein
MSVRALIENVDFPFSRRRRRVGGGHKKYREEKFCNLTFSPRFYAQLIIQILVLS